MPTLTFEITADLGALFITAALAFVRNATAMQPLVAE